jgi:hypothetical protein
MKREGETIIVASTRFAAWQPAKIAGIDRRYALFARTVHGMGVQPFLVLEKGAERKRDLPMLIAFGARWKRPGIAQDVAPVLDKLRLAVERTILHQCTSNRRHDATDIDSRSPRDAGDRTNLSLSLSGRWSILLTSTIKFEAGCFIVYSYSAI